MLHTWTKCFISVFVTVILNIPGDCAHIHNCPEILTVGRVSCKHHGNIKNINIINKSVTDLIEDKFSKFTSVISINLTNNTIIDIPPEFFRNMKNLKHLSIRYNNIKYISGDNFGDMKKLTKLLLDNNKISNISENAFATYWSLLLLSLENNYIEWMDENVFGIHNALKILNMSKNLLMDLNFLKHLKTLNDLNVSFNNIAFLDASIFENMSDLLYLDISHNFLTVLPVNIFHRLVNLKSLFLSHNYIVAITTGTFELNLKTLTLNDNKLQFIGKVLNNISEVYLERNFLHKLDLPKTNITLYIDNNNWDCNFISDTIEKANVKLLYTKHVLITNLRGIPCHDNMNITTTKTLATFNDSDNARGSRQDTSDYYWDSLIIVFIVLGSNLFSLSLIITLYIHYKRKSNLDNIYAEPIQRETARYNMIEMDSGYLTPICEHHHYEELNFYSQSPV